MKPATFLSESPSHHPGTSSPGPGSRPGYPRVATRV